MKKISVTNVCCLSLFALITLSTVVCAQSTSENATASFELVAPPNSLGITEATDIMFDKATISATDIVTANSEKASVSIQELSGEAPGWKLSAKLGDFIGSTDQRKLSGSAVFYQSIKPTTTTTGDTTTILPETVQTDTAFEGTTKGKIIEAGGEATNLVTAAVGKGYGVWSMGYEIGEIQLKIPAGNLKDTYSATLTYTLVDSPN